MRAGDLAPDHPDVGTPNLTLRPVDESDLLAQVEAVETVLVTSSISNMSIQTLLTLRPRCCRHRRSGSDYISQDCQIPIVSDVDVLMSESVPGVAVDSTLGALEAQVATPSEEIRINPTALIVSHRASIRLEIFGINSTIMIYPGHLCAIRRFNDICVGNLLDVD